MTHNASLQFPELGIALRIAGPQDNITYEIYVNETIQKLQWNNANNELDVWEELNAKDIALDILHEHFSGIPGPLQNMLHAYWHTGPYELEAADDSTFTAAVDFFNAHFTKQA